MSKAVRVDILHAIQQVSRSAAFTDAGTVDLAGGTLEIDGVGMVKLPLRPKGVRELLAAAQKAPYGKGTKTLIDTAVRDSLEVKANKIKLPASWNEAVQTAAHDAAARLGILDSRVQAKLYKLLIYQKGGFFLPHRDSEKRKNMVGSLVVMLPSSFGGGELVVEHGNSRNTFTFEKAACGEAAQYVAFYADCRHEVRRVTRGVRVCLHYNLIVQPQRKRSSAPQTSQPDDSLVAAISHWTKSRPGEPLVFALQHEYTERGLKPDLLKGNDRLDADHLIAAAKATDCRVFFGQVSRHLLQFADDGSFERGRYWSPRRVEIPDLHLGETYDDEVIVDGWKDVRGKRVSMGTLPLDGSMLVSPVPLEQWKPTSQDYEGYTGNAGNTLDRWYHKSAVVVWADRHHFDVLVKMGMQRAVDTWLRMREKLPRLSGGKLEQASQDCELLARAIINAWPERLYQYTSLGKEDCPWLDAFANELSSSDDPDLLREFLQTVARRDWQLRLDKLVTDGCRRFAAATMAALLSEFLSTTPAPTKYSRAAEPGLPARDAAWLSKLAASRKQGGMTLRQLADLCRSAAGRFREQMTAQVSRYRHQSGEFDNILADLLKAALAAGDEQCFDELLDLKQSMPKVFDMRAFDVKTCSTLVKWADKRFDERPAQLDRWLTVIRQCLEAATGEPPQPPRDHVRPCDTDCTCTCCRQLAEFLADPSSQSGAIKARKDTLLHVQDQIRHHRLDARSKIDRTTRPFALVLTKTSDSHSRAVQQYHTDQQLLRALPQLR